MSPRGSVSGSSAVSLDAKQAVAANFASLYFGPNALQIEP